MPMRSWRSWRILIGFVFAGIVCAEPGRAQELYWVDDVERTIWRGPADGSTKAAVVTPRLPLALDIASDTLYWIDGAAGVIMRRRIGEEVGDTLVTGLRLVPGASSALAVDPIARILFWIAGEPDGSSDRRIYRAGFDGSEVETVVDEPQLSHHRVLSLDASAGKLYWISQAAATAGQKLRRANRDGTAQEEVVGGLDTVVGLALDTVRSRIYWSEWNDAIVRRAGSDGSDVEAWLTNVRASTLALDQELDRLYFIENDSLKRTDSGGTKVVGLAEIPHGAGMAFDAGSLTLRQDAKDAFWIDGSYPRRMLRARKDGTELDEFMAGFGAPASIAVDTIRATMYWIGAAGEILRARLDGTHAETLANGNCGIGSPTDIELDLLHDKMYWGVNSDCGRALWRADLEGTNTEPVSTGGLNHSSFIGLDPDSESVFWTEAQPSNRISRIRFDGTDGAVVIDDAACGIALDPGDRRLYWTDCRDGIHRADLDGSHRKTLLTGLDDPLDVVLDSKQRHMYWSERNEGRIRRATLEGGDVTTIFAGLNAPERLALASRRLVSESREDGGDAPDGHRLSQNYPNPFNPGTSIYYTLRRPAYVTLKVYDVLSREVAVLVDAFRSAGTHQVRFEAEGLSSGVYFYRIVAGGFSRTRRMVLSR